MLIAIFESARNCSENGKFFTSGGRVLGVTALAKDPENAIKKAYKTCEKIYFENMHYRKDIAKEVLK